MWRLFGASLWASWYSSDASYVNDIVTIEAASNNFVPATVNPADCIAKINELKKLVKESREAQHLDHYGTVAVYPPDWQEFRSTYPTIFASAYPSFQPEDPATGPLTPCPLNEAVAAAIRAQIPVRASKAALAMMIPPSSAVQSMMAAMQQPPASGANLMQQPRASGANLFDCGFRVLKGAFNLLFKLLRLLCCHAADVFVSYSETSIAAGCFINLYLEHLRAMIIATPRIQII